MLGSGTSTGVPRIGNDWGQCDPGEPRNRRSRVSIIVQNDAGQRILVDTSTDLRSQLLANDIDKVDAVFWTHDHADHCHGIDDLRVMRYDRSNPLPGFASKVTCERLRRRFDYVFEGQFGYPTLIGLKEVTEKPLVAGFSFDYVEMPHGPVGNRFPPRWWRFAYLCNRFQRNHPGMLRCFRTRICSWSIASAGKSIRHTALMASSGRKRARKTVLTHGQKHGLSEPLCRGAGKRAGRSWLEMSA